MEFDAVHPSPLTRGKALNATINDFHKIIDYLIQQSEQAPFSIVDIVTATDVTEADAVEFLDILEKAFALKACLEHKKSLRFERDVIKAEPEVDNAAQFNQAISITQDDYESLTETDLLISAADLPDDPSLDAPPPTIVSPPIKKDKPKAPRKSPPNAAPQPPQICLSLADVKNINDFDLICSIAKSVGVTKIQQKPHFLDLLTAHPELFAKIGDAFQTSPLAQEIAAQYREFQKINSPLPEAFVLHQTHIAIKKEGPIKKEVPK